MKTVIILIIFGLIMLVNDFVNDQRGKKKVGKKTKKPKAKKKVNELWYINICHNKNTKRLYKIYFK